MYSKAFATGSQHILLCFMIVMLSQMRQIFTPKSCDQLAFLPMPKKITCSLSENKTHALPDPCSILYQINGNINQQKYDHFIEVIQHQQLRTFGCHNAHVVVGEKIGYQTRRFRYFVHVELENYQLESVFTTHSEIYSIDINSTHAFIKGKTYVSFVRALETFMQAVICSKWTTECFLHYLPIAIQDQPAYLYRSIMIDTARHYLPVSTIFETIDALMYNKMNVLHWHITDDDSFPLKLDLHPEISDFAAFSPKEIYTSKDVKEIVRYAMIRGVRVIPQLDSPGHASTWGLAPYNKGISCQLDRSGSFMGSLDVTLSATYQLVKQIFTQIFTLFPDPFVHLGGDEVTLRCATNQTQFEKQYSDNLFQTVSTKFNKELTYRKIQRKILKQVNSTKRFIYWANGPIELEGDDIVQWWGTQVPQTKQNIIISNYGPFYLDLGFGNYMGVQYGSYNTWLDMYNNNIQNYEQNIKGQIIGAEATLWSELSNRFTHHSRIWIRSSSLAERTWSKKNQIKPEYLRRLTSHEKLMNRRGIPTHPATSQVCEAYPKYCWQH